MNHPSGDVCMPLYKCIGKPRGYQMNKEEAEAVRDRLRSEILNGEFHRREAAKATVAPGAALTFSDVADRYLDTRKRDPKRRAHRHKALAAH